MERAFAKLAADFLRVFAQGIEAAAADETPESGSAAKPRKPGPKDAPK